MMKLTNQLIKDRLLSLRKSSRLAIAQRAKRIATEANLRVGGNSLPYFHLPFIVAKGFVDGALKDFALLTSALIKLEKFALSKEGHCIYSRLMNSLTPGGRNLVEQCNYESDASLAARHRRIDAYLNPKNLSAQVIEINQAAPLALSFYDSIQQIADIFLEEIGLEPKRNSLAPGLLDWFVAEFESRHPGQFPNNIALVIEHGYPPKFTDLPQIAKKIASCAKDKYGESLNIVTCFPYDLKIRENRVYYKNSLPIDMIWRNSVYMDSYIKNGDDIKDYLAIMNSHDKHPIVNSTRVWLTRNKETFAILCDGKLAAQMGLSVAQTEAIAKTVPHTINLYYNKEYLNEVIAMKDQWITKPSDAGFGKGVEFGKNCTPGGWRDITHHRSSTFGYIFQKLVPYPTEEIYDIDPLGNIKKHLIEYDMCPHHIGGSFLGTLLSRANIVKDSPNIDKMNLISGGHLLPIITA